MAPLPFDIDIDVVSNLWPVHAAVQDWTAQAIQAVLRELDNSPRGELSVVFTDDTHIKQLNRDYRHKDKATNVLSFSTPFPEALQGDIILAYETVAREAGDKHVTLRDHVLHLLIHGFLHLQGYDHQDDKRAEIMEAIEIQALKTLGIDNPYEISESLRGYE